MQAKGAATSQWLIAASVQGDSKVKTPTMRLKTAQQSRNRAMQRESNNGGSGPQHHCNLRGSKITPELATELLTATKFHPLVRLFAMGDQHPDGDAVSAIRRT